MTETLDESVSDRAHHNDERPGGSRLSDESADIRRGLIHLNVRIAAVTILRLGQCQEGGMSAQDVYLNCGEDSACNDQDTLSAPEVTALATLIASEITRRRRNDQGYMVCAVDGRGNEIVRMPVRILVHAEPNRLPGGPAT
jgi:hypothetical protein